MKWIWGECSVAMSIGRDQTVVTFKQTWNGLDKAGGRYSPSSPRRRHTWTVTEDARGFVTRVTSAGDHPPQWRR